MRETTKTRINNYTLKMRLYPSAEQKEIIDKIFHALHVAYNITFHEVFQKNPAVCTTPRENGAVWPDFKKIAQKEWRHYLISQNPAVENAPAASLTTQQGLFLLDAKRAWEKTMHSLPVDPNKRKDFHFYNIRKPRRSFLVQIKSQHLIPSPENEKVAWIQIPKVGKIKARGFNTKIRFGENGYHNYTEALLAGELADRLSVRISKDSCGDYYVSVTFSADVEHGRELYLETPISSNTEPVGIDVGIKDIAILSNEQKVENKHFKQKKQKALKKLNRQLSSGWGPSNIAYRDYNKAIRKENQSQSHDIIPKPLAQPSHRYLKTQRKKALIERKIARRRDTYYHQQSSAIVRNSSLIAIETLHVSNMLRNHKLAFALSDAAMSDFLSKLQYKAERNHVEIRCVGTFEPTSQRCSNCGTVNSAVKNLSIRTWICPQCLTKHDRDINAARNILALALDYKTVKDEPTVESDIPRKPVKKRSINRMAVFPDQPDIIVTFSKELTQHNNPRYVIQNIKTKEIVDDAQGVGYRSVTNAKNCYKAKVKHSKHSNKTNIPKQ